MPVLHIKGDATTPIDAGTRVIVHVVNDAGQWGKGFVVDLSERWKEPEEYYLDQHKRARWKKAEFELGLVQWICIEPGDYGIFVVNMIAQHGLRSSQNPVPLRYDELEKCLDQVAAGARGLMEGMDERTVSVHMPKIGSGLAGGEWARIERIVDEVFWDLPVYIYTKEAA
jgi:O-acetyl-ADP-ribose deacetylase (regulator of RNase III)